MTWPTDIQTVYDLALNEIVSGKISTIKPAFIPLVSDQIIAKSEEYNQLHANPSGNKQTWIAALNVIQNEIDTLIDQNNGIIAANEENEVSYANAVAQELEALLTKSEYKWSAIRKVRDNLLSVCDWTQLSDTPLTTDEKTEWTTYRQSLRDIPGTYTTVESIVWPIKPV